MLPVARAIVENVKAAERAERTHALILTGVSQVLCLFQTWASSLQHFVRSLAGEISGCFPTVCQLADNLVAAAVQMSGARALNDLTLLQDADLPENFREQVGESQQMIRGELNNLPKVVADYLVEIPSGHALRLEKASESILSNADAFIQICSQNWQPHEVVLNTVEAITSSISQIRSLVVEIQCRQSVALVGGRHLVIPSGGS